MGLANMSLLFPPNCRQSDKISIVLCLLRMTFCQPRSYSFKVATLLLLTKSFRHTTSMQLARLRGRKTAERVLRRGQLWKGRHMSIRYLPGAPHHPAVDPEAQIWYVGTVASTKLDKSAVKRNRMRRRCREALRIILKEAEKQSPLQLLLVPRSSTLSAEFAELKADINSFLALQTNGR